MYIHTCITHAHTTREGVQRTRIPYVQLIRLRMRSNNSTVDKEGWLSRATETSSRGRDASSRDRGCVTYTPEWVAEAHLALFRGTAAVKQQ